MRIALGLEYDGSEFCGWQSQPNGRAVQDALERALEKVADRPVRTICAGRTDAGVHALAQVVHFDTDAKRPDTAWVRGVNANLPRSVAVRWAHAVPEEFHARFSARGRRYRYLLMNRCERPGLLSNRVGWCHRPLDVEVMNRAATVLLGTHDFSAFRSVECQAKSPVKTLRRAEASRQGQMLVLDFAADGFLHHMVRYVVGALVMVGKGRQSEAWLREVLEGRDRQRGAPMAQACGLYFAGVDYDPVWQIEPSLSDTTGLLL